MTDISVDIVRGDLLSWPMFEMLMRGFKGYAVLDGYALSAQGSPNNTIAVAAGNSIFAGATVNRAAAGNVTIATCSETQYRIDAFYAKNDGTIGVHQGDNAAVSDPLGSGNWRQYIAPIIKAAIPAGAILGCALVRPRAGGVPVIETADIWSWGPLAIRPARMIGPIRVTHDGGASQTIKAMAGPFDISKICVICKQAATTATVDLGWSGDTDALMADADVPKTLNGIKVIVNPCAEQGTAKTVIATVGGGDTVGEWDVYLEVSEYA